MALQASCSAARWACEQTCGLTLARLRYIAHGGEDGQGEADASAVLLWSPSKAYRRACVQLSTYPGCGDPFQRVTALQRQAWWIARPVPSMWVALGGASSVSVPLTELHLCEAAGFLRLDDRVVEEAVRVLGEGDGLCGPFPVAVAHQVRLLSFFHIMLEDSAIASRVAGWLPSLCALRWHSGQPISKTDTIAAMCTAMEGRLVSLRLGDLVHLDVLLERLLTPTPSGAIPAAVLRELEICLPILTRLPSSFSSLLTTLRVLRVRRDFSGPMPSALVKQLAGCRLQLLLLARVDFKDGYDADRRGRRRRWSGEEDEENEEKENDDDRDPLTLPLLFNGVHTEALVLERCRLIVNQGDERHITTVPFTSSHLSHCLAVERMRHRWPTCEYVVVQEEGL